MNEQKAIQKATKYMLRKCGGGSTCACEKVKRVLVAERMQISAGAMVTFADAANADAEDHPNRMPFKGVLLITDTPSNKPPHGSRGHRIYVPKAMVEKHLDGLVGMAVNYDRGGLDAHDTRHKVGIVTKAWIKGDRVWVSGFVWKKDFPEAARDLKQPGLGMSMELANVYVRDEDEDVWHLEDFDFTGATILKKSAAAYYGTELAASATAVASGKKHKGEAMPKITHKETKVAAANTGQGALLVEAIRGAIGSALAPMVSEIRASNERYGALADDLEELKGLHLIQAAKEDDDEEEEDMDAKAEDDDEEEDMDAAKKADDSSEDDGGDDDKEGDDEDLDAMEDLEDQPIDQESGELNKDSKNQGDKTTVTRPPTQKTPNSGGVSEGRLKSSGMRAGGRKRPFPGLKSASIQAAAVEIRTLHAQVGKLKKSNRYLRNQIEAAGAEYQQEVRKLHSKLNNLQAQAEKWAEQVNRKSVVPMEVRNLMAKVNVDPHEIMAGSAPPMTLDQVNQMFSVVREAGIDIDVQTRVATKNRMTELGLMESGEMPYRQ